MDHESKHSCPLLPGSVNVDDLVIVIVDLDVRLGCPVCDRSQWNQPAVVPMQAEEAAEAAEVQEEDDVHLLSSAMPLS